MTKKLFLSLLLLAASPAFAQLGVVGTATFSGSSAQDRNALSTANPFSSKTKLGFGAFLRGDANLIANLEAGVFYTPRSYTVGPNSSINLPTLEIPLLLRITAIPLLSFAVGGYYAYKIGDATAEGTAIPLLYTPLNFNSHDFGLCAAAGFQFPLGPIALMAEARFLFGLADLDPDPIGTLKTRNLQLLAGVILKI